MRACCSFAVLMLISTALVGRAADDPYGDPLPPGAKTRLGTIRYRYGYSHQPTMTPDGKTIYARVGLGLRKYDSAGAPIGAAPRGAPSEVPIAFSADGGRAVNSYSDTIVWDTATGKTLATIKRAPPWPARSMVMAQLSADGKVLAVGSTKERAGKDKEPVGVLVWDVDRNKEIARFDTPHNEQASVALSPDGKLVASWGGYVDPAGKTPDPLTNPGRYVHFWDAATGKALAKAITTGYNPVAAAFSPDGSLAAIAGSSTIELVDPKTGAVKHELLGRSGVGRSLAFSPDGTTLFATNHAGVVQRWRVADGSRLSTTEPPLPDLSYGTVRATGADRGVAWGTRASAMVVWEVPSGKLLGPQTGHVNTVGALAVTPDSRVALTSSYDGQTLAWDLATGKPIEPAPVPKWRGRFGGPSQTEFAPGAGRALIHDIGAGGYGVHDGTTGIQEFLIPATNYNFQKAAFSPDGSKVVTSLGSFDGKKEPAAARVYDVATAKRVFGVELPGHATINAVLTPDGKHLVTASRKPAEKGAGEFIVTTWEVPGGAKKGEFREEAGFGFGLVATAGDNTTAALVTTKGKLVNFNLATGKTTPVVAVTIETVSSTPVFSPDGKLLAVFGQPRFDGPAPIVVLDWETGKTKHTFACSDGGVTSAVFSPDGNYLITGAGPATALVWDLK